MKKNQVLLAFAVFTLAIVGAFVSKAHNESSALTTAYGNVVDIDDSTPGNQPGCESGTLNETFCDGP